MTNLGNGIRFWLLKKIAGTRSVAMNLTVLGELQVRPDSGALIWGCTFIVGERSAEEEYRDRLVNEVNWEWAQERLAAMADKEGA